MSRRLSLLMLLPLMFWVIALVGLLGWVKRDRGEITGQGNLAALVTVAAHLGIAAWLRLTRRRGLDPEWADVQAERHRRQGTCFAAWGLLAAVGWLVVRPRPDPSAPVGWPVVLVVAGNFGFQAVMLGALSLVVAARLRLGRALVEVPAVGV